MNIKTLKQQVGFAAADALVAILIASLFTGLIATLSYNVYIASAGTKRSVVADSYIIDFYEYVDISDFNDVATQGLVDYINNLDDEKISATVGNIDSLNTPYKVKISVEDHIPTGETIQGLVKIVSYTIKYNVGKKVNTIEIRHVKAKDN